MGPLETPFPIPPFYNFFLTETYKSQYLASFYRQENEDQIKKIAKFVEKKIEEVKSDRLSHERELVLASLNIANAIFKLGEYILENHRTH